MATVLDVMCSLTGELSYSGDALVSPDKEFLAPIPTDLPDDVPDGVTLEPVMDRPVAVVNVETSAVEVLTWFAAQERGVYGWELVPRAAQEILVAESVTPLATVPDASDEE